MTDNTNFPSYDSIKIGDKFTITGAYNEGQGLPTGNFPAGAKVTVAALGEPNVGQGNGGLVDVANEAGDRSGTVSVHWLERLDETVYDSTTLTIAFTDEVRDRSKARAYLANAAKPKVLTPEERAVITAASEGETVNLRDLHKALEKVQRSNATRFGQSYGRKTAATEVAHLLYIVNGVLDNHLDGLPVVEQNGPHSPALKAAQREIERLKDDVDTAVKAAIETQANVVGQVERLTSSRLAAQEAAEQHKARADEAEAEAATLKLQVATLALTLEYTRGFLTDREVALGQSYGYEDAVEEIASKA